MYKKYTYLVNSGTEALVIALIELKAKKVIIPTYTCTDILNAVIKAGCEYVIVDCGLDLQIDIKNVLNNADKCDTIIVPHMFGIRANVQYIKENTTLKIVEDLSQCHGLPNLGKYADIVISSTNKSKWIDLKGGGFVFSDKTILGLKEYNFNEIAFKIKPILDRRVEISNEIKEAGVNLIGNESSWLRGMYFTLNSSRNPYIPLHKITEKFDCPIVDSYINKVNWISIIV
jgi:dTDP-4-amino-4,6-dideoxygalactose transaminase